MVSFNRDYNKDVVVSQPSPIRAKLTSITKEGYLSYRGNSAGYYTNYFSRFGYEDEYFVTQQFYLLFNSSGVFYEVEAVQTVYNLDDSGELAEENDELTQLLNDMWEEYDEIFIANYDGYTPSFAISRYNISDQLNYSSGAGRTGIDSFVIDEINGGCIVDCEITWEVI